MDGYRRISRIPKSLGTDYAQAASAACSYIIV